MSIFKNSLLAAVGLALALGTAMPASAAWENHHPRRTEVIERVHQQNVRINKERREGEISLVKAHRLHKAEHRILRHEQMDARLHKGHISKGEQHALNHRLNGVGKRIGG
jgi:hypothetical protein